MAWLGAVWGRSYGVVQQELQTRLGVACKIMKTPQLPSVPGLSRAVPSSREACCTVSAGPVDPTTSLTYPASPHQIAKQQQQLIQQQHKINLLQQQIQVPWAGQGQGLRTGERREGNMGRGREARNGTYSSSVRTCRCNGGTLRLLLCPHTHPLTQCFFALSRSTCLMS